jgi:hypothetical protein
MFTNSVLVDGMNEVVSYRAKRYILLFFRRGDIGAGEETPYFRRPISRFLAVLAYFLSILIHGNSGESGNPTK